MKYDTLLFDLDGTLVDTTGLIVEAFHRLWENNFGYRYDRDSLVCTMGLLMKQAMELLLDRGIADGRIEDPADKPAELDRLLVEYRRIYVELHDSWIQPFEGVDEMLERLQSRGYRMGVVTSKKRDGADRSLRAFGLERRFRTVIAAEDTLEHKPHPAPLIKAMEQLGATPERSAFVGDSTHDMIAGRQAGVFTVAALWGPFDHILLRSTRPDCVARIPEEVLGLFP